MSEPALRQYTEFQIKKQQGDTPAEELKHLSLSAGFFTGMSSISDFKNIERLDIIAMNPRLTSQDLECNPVVKFNSVKHLDLNDNEIAILPACFAEMFPNVTSLELSNNWIGKGMAVEGPEAAVAAALAPLQACESLKVLDLESNPICELSEYRELIFRLIPSLETLDNKTRDGQEVEIDYGSDTSTDFVEEGSEEGSSCFMEDDFSEDLTTSSDDESDDEYDVEKPSKMMKTEE